MKATGRAAWFETALARLLTMRNAVPSGGRLPTAALQAMVLTMPPSARNAAPSVADASFEAT
jgi:hypothetical protein